MSTTRPISARVAAIAAVITSTALALAGCGDELAVKGPGDSASGEAAYRCHETPIPLDALEDGQPATELGADGQEALEGAEVPEIREGDLEEWTIVEESDERLVLIRELDQPDDRGDGTVYTHESLSVERFGPDDDGLPGWHLRSFGSCDLQRDLGDFEPADVRLDPDALPEQGEQLDLLVTERSCASGEPADGRIHVIELEETDEEVRLVVGVEPRSGDQECPSNPPTPFTVELDEPLGDRAVLDFSVHPPRELSEHSLRVE